MKYVTFLKQIIKQNLRFYDSITLRKDNNIDKNQSYPFFLKREQSSVASRILSRKKFKFWWRIP